MFFKRFLECFPERCVEVKRLLPHYSRNQTAGDKEQQFVGIEAPASGALKIRSHCFKPRAHNIRRHRNRIFKQRLDVVRINAEITIAGRVNSAKNLAHPIVRLRRPVDASAI